MKGRLHLDRAAKNAARLGKASGTGPGVNFSPVLTPRCGMTFLPAAALLGFCLPRSLEEWIQMGLCLVLVGALASLGNAYVQWTNPRVIGSPPPALRIRTVMLPFVSLKMILDGFVYFLWLRALADWGLPVWAKVAVTSGFYTPIYYMLFFLGMETFSLGPKTVLSARGLRGFYGRLWGRLKPIWRVDFWYFLVADFVSFYGGPLFIATTHLPDQWTNEAVFVIFCLFDFFYDVLLSRAFGRDDGHITEKHVYLEARMAADHLVRAVRRRRQHQRKQPSEEGTFGRQ